MFLFHFSLAKDRRDRLQGRQIEKNCRLLAVQVFFINLNFYFSATFYIFTDGTGGTERLKMGQKCGTERLASGPGLGQNVSGPRLLLVECKQPNRLPCCNAFNCIRVTV